MDDAAIHLPSLLLQVFLCGHQWFLHGFVLLSLSFFVYKNVVLGNLPTDGLAGNVTLLSFYAILENTRLYQNSKGNKTKQRAPLAFAVALAGFSLICHIYFLQLQPHVYVLLTKLWHNSILLRSTIILQVGGRAILEQHRYCPRRHRSVVGHSDAVVGIPEAQVARTNS
ncbi:Transmembrane protein 80 [Phytophthora oleae]|uniref:Transmembrane protein 80 n=1 Tax=Phytophthora oleae TaxID=2107226 RepID=A0ABD3F8G9_9STRA